MPEKTDNNPYRPPEAACARSTAPPRRDEVTATLVTFLPVYFIMSLAQAVLVDHHVRHLGWLGIAVSSATFLISIALAYWLAVGRRASRADAESTVRIRKTTASGAPKEA